MHDQHDSFLKFLHRVEAFRVGKIGSSLLFPIEAALLGGAPAPAGWSRRASDERVSPESVPAPLTLTFDHVLVPGRRNEFPTKSARPMERQTTPAVGVLRSGPGAGPGSLGLTFDRDFELGRLSGERVDLSQRAGGCKGKSDQPEHSSAPSCPLSLSRLLPQLLNPST